MATFNTGIVTIDREYKIVKADQKFYQFIGWENPMYLEQSVCQDDFPHLREILNRVSATGERAVMAYRVLRPDGTLRWVTADIVAETDTTAANAAPDGCLKLSMQSVDDLEREICGLNNEIRELSTYIDIMDEFFFRYDVERDDFFLFMGGDKQRVRLFHGELDKWEKSILGNSGFSEKYLETFERFCGDLRHGTRHFSHEMTMPHLVRGDEKELYLLKGRTVTDGDRNSIVLGCVYTMAQNSRRRKTRLGADAGRDELTGLLSKRTIVDYINNVFDAGTEGTCYLCVLDVDNFKTVNDNFGHMFGDEVLVTVADIIKDAVGERGVAGRIGGDEMLVFLEDIKDRVDLKSILRTIRTGVEWAYKDVREDLHLSCSIGAAAWPEDAGNYSDLFKIADKMLYRAKEGGKNRYIIYTPDIHGELLTNENSAGVTIHRKVMNIDKDRLLLELTENFLHRGIWGTQFVLEQTGTAFGLAEVDVFYDEPVYTAMHWRADGKPLSEGQLSYANSTKFRQLFNDNKLAVVNHTADLEFACSEAYKSLYGQGVQSALFYRMDGVIPGYVTFYKEEISSRLWTESDKIHLNLIAKMIELVLGGR